jgi:hypothetical protein
MINLYIDMDNTLALFSEKGKENDAILKMTDIGYFAGLSLIDDYSVAALKNPRLLKIANLHIITTCIRTSHCMMEKQDWLNRYFPSIKSRIFVPLGNVKHEALNRPLTPFDVLLDDYKHNIIPWQQAGGTAIKKRSSEKLGYKYTLSDYKNLYKLIKRINNDIERNIDESHVGTTEIDVGKAIERERSN